jgi:DNA processing protein
MAMTVSPEWVALSLVDQLGGVRFRALLDHFGGDVQAILRADEAALRQVYGIGGVLARSIRQIDLARTRGDIARWRERGVRLVTWNDAAYPSRLRQIPDAPPTLFIASALDAPPFEHARCAAIVGTRQPSPASIEQAQALAFQLCMNGWHIVSGLALGIDTLAHIGALAVPEGVTMAVLGGGVLNIYPPGNRALAQAIHKRGVLLSEHAPYANPKPPYLVARNRIMSGICDVVIVVETSVSGGAMHAARRALEQGRRVYAVENGASGNRALLDEGAQPLSAWE